MRDAIGINTQLTLTVMKKNELRNLLNSLFLVGFLVALILYLTMPENRTPFLVVCFISMAIKIAEYIVRYFR